MALRGSSDRGLPSRPMNVEQIVEKALAYDYNPAIPLKYWFRTANTLLKEAEIYEHEGNDQQTYLLLFRHAQLVLKNLANHPDVKSPESKEALRLAETDVVNGIKKLEILKPRIKRRHERYEQLVKDRDARKAAASSQKSSRIPGFDGLGDSSRHQRMPSDPAIAGNPETLAADDNKELAVRLAHKELRRRAVARKSTRQAGISKEVEQGRRTAGLWGDWEEALANNDRDADRDNLSQQLQNVHLQAEANKVNGSRNRAAGPFTQNTRPSYSYPTIPEKALTQGLRSQLTSPDTLQRREAGNENFSSMQPPKPPPKDNLSTPYGPPAIPSRPMFTIPATPSRSETASPSQGDLKPSVFTFKPSAYLENGSPLRTIFLPPNLRHTFLSVAQTNTRANLETCGILCGTLISNALFISKLVIPDQESTSDTCETVNESDLFDYVDGEDLMVLGWIHTHPTQTCFMSSRDLHTHCGYQVMMPESIAIVCAPSKGDWGVFRLTDPPGMQSVLNCTQTGLFHPHAENDIYTDALRPGHVHEAAGLEFEVVDLRPKR
ncbi:hypothetical protein MMC18_004545 [Xylographa bjoerkii]|nr:hypothetical protein [Xylographa bjoerkii]